MSFEIKDSILNIFANDKKIVESLPLSPSDKQVFWIGYRLPKTAQLVAFVSNFNFVAK